MGNDEIRAQIEAMRIEHRDLDAAIESLAEKPMLDQLLMARLKKRKLRLRDDISILETRMIPDIIA